MTRVDDRAVGLRTGEHANRKSVPNFRGALRHSLLRFTSSPERVLHRYLASGAWSAVAVVGTQFQNIAATILIARLAGASDLGILTVLQSTVGMLGTLSSLGIATAATKFIAESRAANKQETASTIVLLYYCSLLIGGGVALLAYGNSVSLSVLIFRTSAQASLVASAAPLVVLTALLSAQIGMLAGFEAFRRIAITTLTQAGMALLTVPMGTIRHGLVGAIIGIDISALVGVLTACVMVIRQCRNANIDLRVAKPSAQFRNIMLFSFPAFVGQLAFYPVSWFTNTVLIKSPGGYVEMAAFAAASQIAAPVLFLPKVLNQLSLAVLSSEAACPCFQRHRTAARFNIKLVVMTALATACGILALAPIIAGSYGPVLRGRYNLILMTTVVAMLTAFSTVLGTVLLSVGRTWELVMINWLWSAATVGASMILVPRYGATGLALTIMAAYVVHAGCQLGLVRRLRAPAAVGDANDERDHKPMTELL